MSISHVNDVEFGAELPAFEPDLDLPPVRSSLS